MDVFVKNHKVHSDLGMLGDRSFNELGLPSNDCGWVGWASLLSRPWFRRIWIVLEYVNATQSLFISGALEFRVTSSFGSYTPPERVLLLEKLSQGATAISVITGISYWGFSPLVSINQFARSQEMKRHSHHRFKNKRSAAWSHGLITIEFLYFYQRRLLCT